MKNTFLHISKFLIIAVLALGGFLFFVNETGFATVTEADLKTAMEDLKQAETDLGKAQEKEQNASNALEAKKAEEDKNKAEVEEKGQTLASYQNELESLKKEIDTATEPRKTEINARITELETGTPPGQGLIKKLEIEIQQLQAKTFNYSSEQQAYDNTVKDRQVAEQKVKEFESNIKDIEAELCLDKESEECKQKQLEAEKAQLEYEQKAYDEATQEYVTCVQNCEDDCEPDDNGDAPYCDQGCFDECELIKSERMLDFENRSRQILSAEQQLYKYQTLKELTFDVESVLDIDSMIVDEQKDTDQKKPYFNDPSGNTPIVSFILRVIDFAIRIIGSIAVLIIIIAGFILVVSVGNDTRIEQGKNAIKYAIVGLAIAFMSYTIVLFVQAIFSN